MQDLSFKLPMNKSIENYLAADDGAGKLMAHARLLTRLAKVFAEVAPTHLGKLGCVANYRSGLIIIHAANGAVAAKLRQLAPSLANEFCVRGYECTGVTVKVQAPEIQRQSTTSAVRPLGAGARRELAGLRERLPPCPLREALGVLLERAATEQ
jgi:hypothetical protein